jgi:hypothetical protein
VHTADEAGRTIAAVDRGEVALEYGGVAAAAREGADVLTRLLTEEQVVRADDGVDLP